jgi:cytochrome P450
VSNQDVPGPKGFGSFHYLNRIRRVGILDALVELWRDFGDLVRFQTPFGPLLYFVYDPQDVQQILLKDARKFIKGKAVEPFKLLVGNGLSVTENNVWLAQRRLVQPSFHMKSLEGYGPTMIATVKLHRERWISGMELSGERRIFDFNKAMSELTHDIVARTLLGKDLGPRLDTLQSSWSTALTFIVKRANQIIQLPLWLPLPSHLRFNRAMRTVTGTVDQIIKDQLEGRGSVDQTTLLARMLAARKADSQAQVAPPVTAHTPAETASSTGLLTDRDIRDQVLNFLFAGHETTANAMAWSTYLILQNPPVKEKLLLELQQVLAGRTPNFQQLAELKYLRQVMFEALRVYPPVSMFVREALEEVQVGKYKIPKGAVVIISPFVMHRRPDLWKDGERFHPERFDDPATRTTPPAFLAFGAGGRACVGDNFAVNEMMVVMADLLQNIDFALNPQVPVKMHFNGTLRPEPFKVSIAPRSRSQS